MNYSVWITGGSYRNKNVFVWTYFCTFKLTLCPGGPWGPATPGGPVKPWNHRSLDVIGMSWDNYKLMIIIIIFTYCCSGFPTLPRRPLQNQKSTMRMCKQELWRRAVQRWRSYRWSHFAFSWRPPLTRWTLLSSRSQLTLREQQHRRHHPAPQFGKKRKSIKEHLSFVNTASGNNTHFLERWCYLWPWGSLDSLRSWFSLEENTWCRSLSAT